MISRADLERWSKADPSCPTAIGAAGFANMFGGDMENGALMLRISEWSLGELTIHKAAAVSREIGTYEKSMSRRMTAPIAGALAGNVLGDFRVRQRRHLFRVRRSIIRYRSGVCGTGAVRPARYPGGDRHRHLSRTASDVKSAVHPDKPLAVVADALSGNPGAQKRLTLERAGVAVNVTVTVA